MNMTRVEYVPPTFHTAFDYSIEDALKLGHWEWREDFVKEYANIGFPKWKRLNLLEFPINSLKAYKGDPFSGNAKYKRSEDSLDSDLFNYMVSKKFEGAHPKFTLMSRAFFNTGFFAEMNDEEEFLATYDLSKNPSIVENSVMIVKKSAHATIIRELKGNGFSKVGTTTFLIEKGAKVKFFNIILAPEASVVVDSNLYIVEESADVKVYDVVLGGKRVASNHRFELVGRGAKSTLKSVYFENKKERADLQYELINKADETSGRISGKGVVKDESYVVFRGLTEIKKGAFNAETEESSYTLSLSPTARMDAIPSMWVRNNSVSAKHSASMGSLDEKKLYYMMSRGLSKKAVLHLVIKEMFAPVMDVITNENVKKDVENELFNRI